VDFQLNEDQLQIREMVRKFAQHEIAPIAVEVDREARFPVETFEKMAELGLLGLLTPEAYGGVGQSIVTFCVAMEEIASGCAATALSYLVHSVLCAHSLSVNASEAQKAKYLPEMVAGKRFASIAMTEPGAGSDVLSMQTTARRCNGDYLLNGSKTFITNAPIADIFLVYARTGPSGDQNGISFFIVERGMPGFSVGQPFHKMGVRGSPTAELFFDNCRVPSENIVRGENEALGILMSGLDVERTAGAAMGVGLARAAFEKAVAYAREREQFGKPIIHFEMIMEKLANMSTDIEAARLLTFKAADLCDKGIRCSAEASQAKLFASEMSVRATSEAMQILGGYGYMQEYEFERMLRDARLGTVGAGTSEIQRLIIAREIIKRNGR
jgi:isovaleryl-CoA dehydrogenase